MPPTCRFLFFAPQYTRWYYSFAVWGGLSFQYMYRQCNEAAAAHVPVFLQPQLVVLPLTRLLYETTVSSPQSHRHFHMTLPCIRSSIGNRASSLPKRCPEMSLTLAFNAKDLPQPQLLILPFKRALVEASISRPQSQRQSQR